MGVVWSKPRGFLGVGPNEALHVDETRENRLPGQGSSVDCESSETAKKSSRGAMTTAIMGPILNLVSVRLLFGRV